MSETTWIQIRKKRRRGKVLLITLVGLVIVAIFVRNNRDILLQHFHAMRADGPPKQSFNPQLPEPAPDSALSMPDTASFPTISQDSPVAPPQTDRDFAAGTAPVKTSAPAAPEKEDRAAPQPAVKPAAAPMAPPVQQSVVLDIIRCTIRDRGDLRVIVGLELFFSGDSDRQEILLKREDLKVMVLQVFTRKSLDDMVVESLRPEIKNALNRIVTHAPISDLEFRDFRIEKD